MSDFEKKWIVQDLETGEFLCPDPLGGIGTTMYVKQAGQFDDYQIAFEAGKDEFDGGFFVFGFFVNEQI